jgi:hypothetical protein
MFPTAEVRWFFRGEVPANIWEWFHAGGHEPEEQSPRVDHYLRNIDGDSLGVKLREGRIEIKQRLGGQTLVRFGKRSDGYVARWVKWSFELAEASGVVAELSGSSSRWIGIWKARKVLTFQVTDEKSIKYMSGYEGIDRGCAWEIAKVKVDGVERAWWSVGFEAFGNETELGDTLMMVVNQSFSVANAPEFNGEQSYGYPNWLQKVST